jgi:hypothetical protein
MKEGKTITQVAKMMNMTGKRLSNLIKYYGTEEYEMKVELRK